MKFLFKFVFFWRTLRNWKARMKREKRKNLIMTKTKETRKKLAEYFQTAPFEVLHLLADS